MENVKIAYCIPTYNRPEQISVVLKHSLAFFKKYGVDIYIYDSSDNDDTKEICEQYVDYHNFCYLKLPHTIKPMDKYRMILEGRNHKIKYDYIWFIKDRVYCSEEIISQIVRVAKDEPDVIFLRAIENKYSVSVTNDCYHNCVDFYRDWAWLVTSWDVTILNRKKITSQIDWNKIEDKYYINGGLSFVIVVLLFDKLSEYDDCYIQILPAEAGSQIINIPIEKNIDSLLFDCWGYEWYKTNMNLPDIYNEQKIHTIKSANTLPWLIGNEIRLINLWHEGILNDDKLSVVKDIWSDISDISWATVCRIKSGERVFMENCVTKIVWDSVKGNNWDDVEYYRQEISWMKKDVVTKDFLLTIYMMEILQLERQNGKIHIFDGGNTSKYVFMKIDAVIKFVMSLEKEIDVFRERIGMQMRILISSKCVSSSMIVYLINKVCKDSNLVFQRFIDFMTEEK